MSTTSWEEIKRLAADFQCCERSCRKVRVGVPLKNLLILKILMSIHSKHYIQFSIGLLLDYLREIALR